MIRGGRASTATPTARGPTTSGTRSRSDRSTGPSSASGATLSPRRRRWLREPDACRVTAGGTSRSPWCSAPSATRPRTSRPPRSSIRAPAVRPATRRPTRTAGSARRCHTGASWANRLGHPLALAGRHTSFACEKCHTKGFDAPGLSCDDCHHRPHPDRGPCLKCHTMTSFATNLSHPFTLAGRHASFVCEKCHTRGLDAPGLDCDSCHHRPHPYYGPCFRCHTMTSFASSFSHPVRLVGVHAGFDCSRCHVNGIGSPGVSCTSCHGSNHGGLTNCAQCHTQAGWRPTTFRHGTPAWKGGSRWPALSATPTTSSAVWPARATETKCRAGTDRLRVTGGEQSVPGGAQWAVTVRQRAHRAGGIAAPGPMFSGVR